MVGTDSLIEWSGTSRSIVEICEQFIHGVTGLRSAALFRLIRPPYSALFGSRLELRRCAQKPHGSSTVSARINHAKSFQMKQIVPQSTVGNR